MTSIRAENVSLRLRDRLALKAVTFGLDRPGLTAVVGPNGAGKSTLLRALAGLAPIQHGRLEISGHDVGTMSAAERATTIGYLPQERTVHWSLSARDIVALGRLPRRGPASAATATDDEAVASALLAMDATHLASRPVLELSGGERARILIARVLAQQTTVILADEPTSGLDPSHQWALFERLESAAAGGTRIVVALHDLALASRFAAEVLVISAGRLVASGTPAEVLTPATLADVFGIEAVVQTVAGRRIIIPVGRAPAP